MVKILGREGAGRQTQRRFYVAVVQVVILFGSETWVVTPRMDKALAGFHHRSVWQMKGMGHGIQLDRTWVYPTIGAALKTVGIDEICVYTYHRQNRVAKYIVTSIIMDLCLAADQRPVIRLSRRWWDQPDLNILRITVGNKSA